MSKSFQKGYLNIVFILILIIGIIAGLYLVKKPTNILPKAYEENPNSVIGNPADVQITSNGRFGIAIDIQKPEKIPNVNQLFALSPGWVRFVVTPITAIPSLPKDIKNLIVFNAESVPGRPRDADFSAAWHVYIDKYIKGLEDFIKENPGEIDAIEVWNEEDLCDKNYDYCPGVPEVIYTDILKRAAAIIKQYNPNIKVIMGGLVTNDIFDEDRGYLGRVLRTDPDVFNQVDALGLHPYGKTLNNWCSTKEEKCAEVLPWGDIKDSVQRYKTALPVNVKVWVTEVGQATNDLEWQKEYMKMVFDYLPTEADVVIWYAWTDKMLAVEDVNTDVMQMGLYDRSGKLKPAGELFKSYSTAK